jgi:hypothetical protein
MIINNNQGGAHMPSHVSNDAPNAPLTGATTSTKAGSTKAGPAKISKKRPWRAPEIVNVGGVLDLTEAVGGNLSDSGGASPPSYQGGT